MPRALSAALLGVSIAFVSIAPALAAPYFGPPPGITLTSGHPNNALMLRRPAKVHLDPKFMRQVVPYSSNESAGTLVVNTGQHFLYLVLGGGKALRYGIG